MDVSDTECVARSVADYKGRHVSHLLRLETCKSKSRVYAAETKVSLYISKDTGKRVVPRIYTTIIVHLHCNNSAFTSVD